MWFAKHTARWLVVYRPFDSAQNNSFRSKLTEQKLLCPQLIDCVAKFCGLLKFKDLRCLRISWARQAGPQKNGSGSCGFAKTFIYF
jgi:hypothetical protein